MKQLGLSKDPYPNYCRAGHGSTYKADIFPNLAIAN